MSWFENFEEKEIPPENLWDDSEAVEAHFKMSRERRAAEMKGETFSDDDEHMMGNDLADSFRN
jgi:hypothetical protein